MNEQIFTPQQLSKLLNVSPGTLKHWENTGQIEATKTKGGHRRYIYSAPANVQHSKKNYIYARVSSSKQKSDLERQIAHLQAAYPSFEVISDIASGINFRRRGLITLLDQVIAGGVSNVVVAHKDRLTRFGFELFQLLFQRFGVTLTVLSDSDIEEPITELAKDLLSVVTVFTARFYGSRSYKVLQKDKVLPNKRTGTFSKPMHRGIKVFLQQSSKRPERTRNSRTLVTSKTTSPSDEE